MQRMVGFRHVDLHEDTVQQLPNTVHIITHHLDEFTAVTRQILQRDIPNNQP